MDTQTLALLLSVARTGSFAAAARELDQDPSIISRRVAAAEATLGLRLFERSTRVLSVTEAGEAYLSRIAPLLEGLEEARDAARDLAAAPQGRVRIATSTAFGQVCIAPHLTSFREAFPALTLDLALSDTPQDLIANGIDLAFRLAPAPKGDLISRRVLRTRYRVVAHPSHARLAAPSELSGANCIRQDLPDFRTTWRFRDDAGTQDVAIDGTLISSNPLMIREAARQGLGPALLANWLVAGDLKSGRLVDLFPTFDVTATSFDTGVWALYPSRSYLPAKTRAALDFFAPRLSQLAPNA